MVEPRLQTIVVALDALERRRVVLNAEWFRVIDRTSEFALYIEGQFSARPMERGMFYRAPAGEKIEYVDLEDYVGVSNTITLAFGDGDFQDGRMLGVADVPAHGIGAGETALNNNTPTALLAANVSVRKIVIVADKNNTIDIRVSPVVCGSMTDGIPLQPGQSLSEEARCAWEAFANVAGQKVHYYYLTTNP